MKQNQYEINVKELFFRVLQNWPIMLALGLIGALIGFIVSIAHPPLYESSAVLGVNLYYGITDTLELIVENRALDRVAAVIKSDHILTKVLQEIPDNTREFRGWNDPDDLRNALRLDRRMSEWALVALDEDPQLAAYMAQIWAEVSLTELAEYSKHAWRAVALMGNEKFELECERVPGADPSKGELEIICAVLPIDLDEEALNGSLQTEIELSHGILPDIQYELLQAATPPDKPILWGRGTLVLAGALAGLIVAIIIILFRDRALERC
jgi:hypothetical protein